jgi:3-oxoacyl-[acyl-carrier-protein] synthase III
VLDVRTAPLPTPAPAPGAIRPTRAAGIAGLAAALPDLEIPSAEIAERLGVAPGWIERRTGIRNRRRLAPGERLSDLATVAARRALADAGIDPAAVDTVLVASITQDELTPGAAPLVAHGLGGRARALDLNGACTGFLAGLELGASLIEAGRSEVVVLVGAEAMSRILDHDDRRTAGLFGDGAAAVVLTPADGDGLAPVVLRSDGAGAGMIRARRDEGVVRMQGHETFLAATAALVEATTDACAAAGLALGEIDLFVFHQANGRILDAVAERLDIDRGRVVDAIADVGNTSGASVPLALVHARDEGRLQAGRRVVVGAMGAGFLYGAGVITWS